MTHHQAKNRVETTDSFLDWVMAEARFKTRDLLARIVLLFILGTDFVNIINLTHFFAVLFVYLLLIGLVSFLWLSVSNRRLHEKNSESPAFYKDTSNGFDSGLVRGQVENLRQRMGKSEGSAGRDEFKRSIRLAESREKIAQFSYFQAPPQPAVEPEDPHHGANLILV